MDIRAWMQQHNHVAHSSLLRRAGFSDYAIRQAVATGMLRRTRRSWLTAPDCEPRRIRAAEVGGRLTCVSAAALMGLWRVDAEDVHVALPRSASRFERAGLCVHRSQDPVVVPRFSSEEPILNVLFHVARCQTRADALAIWESAVRRDLVGADTLERVHWRSRRASEIATAVGGRSDSGPESVFADLLREAGIPVRQQYWVDGHPLDALIGERLGVQIDGYAYHSDAAARRRDIRADARLALRGYTILRFDYQQVFYDKTYVLDTVRLAMAQGLHRR